MISILNVIPLFDDMPQNAASDAPASELMEQTHIIDTDFHLEGVEDVVIEYLESSTIKEKVSEFGFPRRDRMRAGTNPAYSTDQDISNMINFHGSANSPEAIRETADSFGIDKVITTPPNRLASGLTNYPHISTAVAKAYNDMIVDRVIDARNGIYAHMIIPHWNPSVAAEEIGRVGRNPGIVGGHSLITSKLWGGIENDPIFHALVDNSLPLVMHLGAMSSCSTQIDAQLRTWIETNVIGPGGTLIANVVNMIANGVFEKFPDLNVVWQEVGTQWIPYLANRLDDQYQLYPEDIGLTPRMAEMKEQYLAKMPSEYIYENMFVTTQPIALPNGARETRAVLTSCHASDTFLFSSDWPHHATDLTNWLDREGISEDVCTGIAHGNAQKAYPLG